MRAKIIRENIREARWCEPSHILFRTNGPWTVHRDLFMYNIHQMKKKNTTLNYATKKMIDMNDKGYRDHWLRHWGISIHQLRAAVRNTNSHEVRLIREELKRKGAI